eukprot:119584_1
MCNDPFQCVGPITTDRISAGGYKSASDATTSVTITTANGISECGGSFSCYKILFIDILGADLRCTGSNSCRNVSSFIRITGGKSLYCTGTNACAYSNLRAESTIGCYGDQSCAFSNIEQTNIINGYGAYSLYKAVIDSNGALSDTITVNLEGFNAGFGATIICRSADTCNINCYGNACFMTHIDCRGSNNCIVNTNSNLAINPITDIGDFDDTGFSLLYNSLIMTLDNDQHCNQESNSKLYDVYGIWQTDGTIISNANQGSMCCRATFSCNPNITFTTTTQDFLLCSADEACGQGGGGLLINNNGPIFAEAGVASFEPSITTSDNLYCWGDGSCIVARAPGLSGQNVFCSGWQACAFSNIRSHPNLNVLNVYLLGKSSAEDITINCTEGYDCFILCGAYDACNSTILYCYGECTVECEYGNQCPQIISANPTSMPTQPTINPTITTNNPSSHPTLYPSDYPSYFPTRIPSDGPTTIPSDGPTTIPSDGPTGIPTSPTLPTSNPSQIPTFSPTQTTMNPSWSPTVNPIMFSDDKEDKCPNQYAGYLNTTYKTSILPEFCDEKIKFISFVSLILNMINITYNKQDSTKQHTYSIISSTQRSELEKTPFCGNVSFHVITCYDENINAQTLLNITKSPDFEADINIYNNSFILYVQN